MAGLSWEQICEDKRLADLPFKIETNQHGQIVMSPANYWHSAKQGKIAGILARLASEGDVSTETAILTAGGVKVADVAWASPDFLSRHGEDDPELKAAPRLCVEIISGSNTTQELLEKRILYFAQGAHEVWTCNREGQMTFYGSPTETLERSTLVETFPSQLGGY